MDPQAEFERLQRKLVPLWSTIDHPNSAEQTIVVVPSLSVDVDVPGDLLCAYEERSLFLLLLLRQPRARMVYVSSQAVGPEVVDYYLELLPGVVASEARERLFLLSPLDPSPRPLAAKLLERPALVRRIRDLVLDPDRAHVVPFTTTHLERDLALALGIPMYGADPRFAHVGTKSGCRRLFADEGVKHPSGVENVASLADVVGAIATLRARRAGLRQVIVKHNEGVSGWGNAVVDLEGLPPRDDAAVEARLRRMRFEAEEITYDGYMQDLAEKGGVVEERIVGDEFRSPSVQLRVTPMGTVELLSTHDQMLGGPSGQSYLGARFPADAAYAVTIAAEAEKIGRRLAREGVIGRFAIDFVAVRAGGRWDTYAIELNLRKGGTTHPFLTLQFLTDGAYHADTGTFRTPQGDTKCFVASDHVVSPAYRRFTPPDVFDLAVRRGLHFDRSRQTGVVFHMLSALGEYGRLGLTAVGDGHDEADALFARTVAALDEEASRRAG